MSSTPTVKAAVKFALELQRKADAEKARDPWAKPYRPTEASARKLCAREANNATRELPVTATVEEIEAARATGPARAIAKMQLLAREYAKTYRVESEESARSLQRLRRRHEQARRERDRERAHLSLGQRADGVVARLSVVASTAAVPVERSSAGSERDLRPVFAVDASQRARAILARCVRELEELEDEMTVRDLREAA